MSQRASTRFQRLLGTSGWFVPAFRIFEGVSLTVLGAYLPFSPGIIGTFLVMMVVFFGFIEVLMHHTNEDIRASARDEARAEAQQQTEQMSVEHKKELEKYRQRLANQRSKGEYYQGASVFLSSMLQEFLKRSTAALHAGSEKIELCKREDIRAALQHMCESFQDYARTNYSEEDLPDGEVFFRSTFMEVQDDPPQLVYQDWYTPEGREPLSVVKNITYSIGVGIAGQAWAVRRPVIEDFAHHRSQPDDGTGFVENYPLQQRYYESMVCVPVAATSEDMREKVLGIVTVDTNIEGFFRDKGNRYHEQRAGALIRPYADFIAFVLSVTRMPALARHRDSASAPSKARVQAQL